MNDKTDLSEIFGDLDDEAWLQVVLGTLRDRSVRGVTLPGFASDDVQRTFVGSAGEHTLREGWNFYLAVKGYAEALGNPIRRDSKVLDFGCGWGRMLRFFFKDVRSENVHGSDVDPDIVATCRATFGGYGQFTTCQPAPPLDVPDETYDAIYLYSVFSHLNEEMHMRWVREFARVLKRGGVILATTQGRGFLDFCASLQKPENQKSEWHRSLARCFRDRDQALRDYEAGRFLHEPTGGGDHRPSSFYGETIVPRGFVERNWEPMLALRDFRDDPSFLPQAVIVAQKP